MKKTYLCLLCLSSLLLVPAVGLAKRPVDETRAAAPDARVHVETVSGSVTVSGWDRDEVSVRGTIGDDTEGLEIEGSAESLIIEVDIPRRLGRGKHDVDADLEIRVPAAAHLSVETVSASVDAVGLSGRLEIETVSGNIEASGTCDSAELSSVSGSIRFSGAGTRVDAESVSGKIRLQGVAGSADVSTVSGNITLEADELERGNFESVAGTIEVTGRLAPRARLDFEAHSSNVVLTLPADVAAYFEIETFSGDIDNEFGPPAQRTGRYAPGKSLEFSTAPERGNEARVSIETFSGNVALRKR